MGQLDSTYGAMLIGVFLSAILFGVTNLQMFIYFQRCSRDIIWNKLAVCWLWLLDALHLAFCLHMVYWYFIINYDNPEELLYIVWSFKGQIILDSIVVISVHTLYVIRIWKLNAIVSRRRPGLRHKILPCSLSVVMLAGFGAALVLCYEINQFNQYTDLLRAKWVTYLPLAVMTSVDALIATSMCYLLARCRTGFKRTDSLITILMIFTLNTGVITSLCSLTAIVTFGAIPHSFVVLSVEFLVTKLYINSFMAMFNARNTLRLPGPRTNENIVLAPVNPASSGSAHDRKGHQLVENSTHSLRRSDLGTSVDSSHVPVIDVDIRPEGLIYDSKSNADEEDFRNVREPKRLQSVPLTFSWTSHPRESFTGGPGN